VLQRTGCAFANDGVACVSVSGAYPGTSSEEDEDMSSISKTAASLCFCCGDNRIMQVFCGILQKRINLLLS
jgi:hypothetical protein